MLYLFQIVGLLMLVIFFLITNILQTLKSLHILQNISHLLDKIYYIGITSTSIILITMLFLSKLLKCKLNGKYDKCCLRLKRCCCCQCCRDSFINDKNNNNNTNINNNNNSTTTTHESCLEHYCEYSTTFENVSTSISSSHLCSFDSNYDNNVNKHIMPCHVKNSASNRLINNDNKGNKNDINKCFNTNNSNTQLILSSHIGMSPVADPLISNTISSFIYPFSSSFTLPSISLQPANLIPEPWPTTFKPQQHHQQHNNLQVPFQQKQHQQPIQHQKNLQMVIQKNIDYSTPKAPSNLSNFYPFCRPVLPSKIISESSYNYKKNPSSTTTKSKSILVSSPISLSTFSTLPNRFSYNSNNNSEKSHGNLEFPVLDTKVKSPLRVSFAATNAADTATTMKTTTIFDFLNFPLTNSGMCVTPQRLTRSCCASLDKKQLHLEKQLKQQLFHEQQLGKDQKHLQCFMSQHNFPKSKQPFQNLKSQNNNNFEKTENNLKKKYTRV